MGAVEFDPEQNGWQQVVVYEKTNDQSGGIYSKKIIEQSLNMPALKNAILNYCN